MIKQKDLKLDLSLHSLFAVLDRSFKAQQIVSLLLDFKTQAISILLSNHLQWSYYLSMTNSEVYYQYPQLYHVISCISNYPWENSIQV